jgi:hypothetical protein
MAKKGKPQSGVKDAVERIRNLNERIVDAVKESGEESLKIYERALRNLAEATESAGGRGPEWMQEFARTQAEAARKLAEAFPALLERVGLHNRESKEKPAAKAEKVSGPTRGGSKTQRVVASEQLPIAGYDKLNVHEITQRLSSLSQAELGKVDAYESRTKNRKTVRDRIAKLRS